jgi:hypothetical protein
MKAHNGEKDTKKEKVGTFVDDFVEVWRRPTHDGRRPRYKNKYKKLYNQQTKTFDCRRRDITCQRNDFPSYGRKDLT